jgi:hypothetical protein
MESRYPGGVDGFGGDEFVRQLLPASLDLGEPVDQPRHRLLTKTDELFTRARNAQHQAVTDLAWLTSTWGDA